MIGAYAKTIIGGTILSEGIFTLAGVGEPLGAFVAAYLAVEIGGLVAGKTKVDILVTPITTITVGSVVGLSIGVPIAAFMTKVGELINWGAVQQPFWAGIIVSVLMGIALTLPISSAAIGVSLNLSGIAAGAAAVGCAANMVGFAVASFRENKTGGLVAQGLGTSMLQMPNIIRKPVIWLPAILASAILGPISTCVLGMTNNATGSGMGTCGLVGQIMAFQTMTGEGMGAALVLLQILLMHVAAPAILALLFSELMRKKGWFIADHITNEYFSSIVSAMDQYAYEAGYLISAKWQTGNLPHCLEGLISTAGMAARLFAHGNKSEKFKTIPARLLLRDRDCVFLYGFITVWTAQLNALA